MTRRTDIPGLGLRYLSLCDTPDLDIVVRRFRVRQSVRFDAELELPWLHLGLAAAGILVRSRLVASLVPWAGIVRRLAALLERFGTDRGGMIVDARGLDGSGCCIQTTWTLLAEAGDGPSVPTLPALALLRALSKDRIDWRGAGPCVGVLTLSEIEREFGALRIATSFRTERFDVRSVFPAILGVDFGRLSEPLSTVHRPGWGLRLEPASREPQAGSPALWAAYSASRPRRRMCRSR